MLLLRLSPVPALLTCHSGRLFCLRSLWRKTKISLPMRYCAQPRSRVAQHFSSSEGLNNRLGAFVPESVALDPNECLPSSRALVGSPPQSPSRGQPHPELRPALATYWETRRFHSTGVLWLLLSNPHPSARLLSTIHLFAVAAAPPPYPTPERRRSCAGNKREATEGLIHPSPAANGKPDASRYGRSARENFAHALYLKALRKPTQTI